MNALNYLYSIRPRHVADILNGKKTFELRKSAPKPPFVMWVYCTKTKPYLYDKWVRDNGYVQEYIIDSDKYDKPRILNGLVVAKCVVDGYEEIKVIEGCFHDEFIYTTYPRLLKQLCLTDNEVTIYGKGKVLYALHLTQVEMLDKPLQVGEFHSWNFNKWHEGRHWIPLTRAPQSYQKVKAPYELPNE